MFRYGKIPIKQTFFVPCEQPKLAFQLFKGNFYFMETLTCKCGSNEYHLQSKAQHIGAYCDKCNSFIKWLPQDNPKFYVGRYKDTYINDCTDVKYLQWYLDTIKLSLPVKNAIKNRITEVKNSLR